MAVVGRTYAGAPVRRKAKALCVKQEGLFYQMSENSNSIFRAVLTGSAWSFVGVLLAVAFFYWQEYRNPFVFKIEVLDEFNLVEVREQIKDLRILYKNEDIIESKQEIKVIRIQVRNEGDTILQGYYDQLEPFGLRFVESKVLTSEVVNTNSDDLKNRLIKGVESESDKKYSDVIFSKVIFDEGDFVNLKVTILLDESHELKPESVTLQANIPRKSPSALTGAINCRKIGCECLKRAA